MHSALLQNRGLQNCTLTHTHTHTRLTALWDYPGEPVPEGKAILDLNEARDSEWQWHQLGHMQVCTSLQIGFAFLVLAHPGSLGKGPLNACVRACVCV